ncbi:major facilitator superfamily domain-containing protein 12-like [Ischnura elegans]|uniref:major facilitator superfamily domain-containing protein 12-like n=1 Tax=Ischnura elegans TaxID=197161 RepID=UPI001ED88E31|nr:major facilitator superfamily domain-containing protein 12-like [Ischnura elegans]
MAPPYHDSFDDEDEEPLLLKITGLIPGYYQNEPFKLQKYQSVTPLPSIEPPRHPLVPAAPSGGRGGPTVVVEGLPWSSKAAYGVGHILNDICASMWFSYTLLFFHAVLGMDGKVAGALLLLGQIVDALATPVVGILADKNAGQGVSCGRWQYGRRKSWHLGGTIAVVLSFPFIFMMCVVCTGSSTDDWAIALYYSLLVTVFQIGWASVQISHLSLITDLTPSEHQRTELTAIRYSLSVCSNVAVYFITWMVLHLTKGGSVNKIGPSDAYKFRNIVLIGLALGLFFTFWFHLGLKEITSARRTPSPSNSSKGSKWLSQPQMKFFKSTRLYQVAFLYVSSRLYATLSQVYMPLYLDDSLDLEAEYLATIPLVSYASSFITSLIVKYINKRMGRKPTYLIGGIVSIVACIWIYYGEGPSYVDSQIYFVAALIGGGSSITLVTSLCITADLIGTNTESGASVYSAVTFADKLFNGIAVMTIENLKCTGDSCPNYYRDALAFVCGGTALLGLISLATLITTQVGSRRGN